MTRLHSSSLVVACLALACVRYACAGMQHLVAPGESWEALAEKVQPGDEIILMPGRHKPVVFETLAGTKDAPITIRSLDRTNPSVIQAARHGLLIVNPRFIIIENIEVTGASIAGIALRPLPAPSSDAQQKPQPLNEAYVQLRHVKISKIGPTGRRDAIEIVGQNRVTIEDCTFEGWGGAAVAILSSSNVTIENCTFKALPDHSQSEGILMRAGAKRISVSHCSFELHQSPAIVAGGRSDLATFQPAIAADAKPGSVFEVRDVQVTQCTIVNAQTPIVMQSADEVLVRSCTFVRPRTCLVYFDHKHEDPRMAVASRFIFGDNLVTWQPGDLAMYSFAPPEVGLRSLTWEQNLWWSAESVEARKKLGEWQGDYVSDQITDIDPMLDEDMHPQAADAKRYGANAP